MRSAIRFNPLDPAFLANPYPTYRELRELEPVHRSVTGSWVLTGYEDVRDVLRDRRFRTPNTLERVLARASYERSGGNLDELALLLRGFFFFSDPPDHAALRKLVSGAFTPKLIASLHDKVAACVSERLADLEGRDTADVIGDFAVPVAGQIIGRMMGLRDEDSAHLQTLSRVISPILDSLIPLEGYERMNPAAAELREFFSKELTARRASGCAEDVLTRMLEHEDAVEPEILPSAAATIFFTGQETTGSAIGMSVRTLLAQPEILDALGEEGLGSDAAWPDELLRYEAPVQLTAREALEEVEVRGTTIAPGQRVVAYLGAANRDPGGFPDPDRVDLTRDFRQHMHLSFGEGIHHCVGACLVRMEVRLAVRELMAKFPEMRLLDAEPVWRPGVSTRGLEHLHVSLDGR